MKTLFLLRHAKSSKGDASLKDFDRPLNETGKDDAKLIGRLINEKRISPDLVLSSPAKRARATAELVLKAAGMKVEPGFDERIYEASVRKLLEIVSQVEATAGSVMLVGHNPGFEELCEALTGKATHLPTASLARIELAINKWSDVRPEAGSLKWLVAPKELKRE
jgi:phosphohistidine phosphatase